MSAADPGDIVDAADTALAAAERIELDERRSAGHAPGGYTCRCHSCNYLFRGDRRATRCIPCADQLRTVRQQERDDRWENRPRYVGAPVVPDVTINVPNADNFRRDRQIGEVVRRALAMDRGSREAQADAFIEHVVKKATIVRVQDALTKPKRNINLD